MNRIATFSFKNFSLLSIALLTFGSLCFSQPTVTVSPKSNPPTTNVHVSGSGFSAYAAIDIYFDTTDEALASANASGSFSKIAIQVPASAVPGKHWITAVQRSNDNSAQTPFRVNTNWAEDGFAPKRQRSNPYENVLNPSTVGAIDEQWSFTTGGDRVTSPAVANGVVYVGSNDNNVYALNAATGAKLWSFTTGNFVYSSPAVADGVVYVGSVDNNVYALNAATGAKLWSFTTGSYVYSSPAVADGVVYVGSNDNNVYALNATTGAKLWSFTTVLPIASSPAVADGVVYVGSDGTVYALNATNSIELWSFSTPTPNASSPAVADGVVYFGSNYLYALNAATGAQLWVSTVGSSPAVANGVVYVGSGDDNVYALNATTGAELWSFATGNSVFSYPAVANGVVYVGSTDYNVYAFSSAGGEEVRDRQQVRLPERLALSTLHPDLSLKVSQPTTTPLRNPYDD